MRSASTWHLTGNSSSLTSSQSFAPVEIPLRRHWDIVTVENGQRENPKTTCLWLRLSLEHRHKWILFPLEERSVWVSGCDQIFCPQLLVQKYHQSNTSSQHQHLLICVLHVYSTVCQTSAVITTWYYDKLQQVNSFQLCDYDFSSVASSAWTN